MVSRLPTHAVFLISLALAASTLTGCAERKIYPVSGQIVDPDGNPVTEIKGAAIEFESLDFKASANSSIDENGNFSLTTQTAGDGAHVGKNRVAIIRAYVGPENPVPHVIHPKYEKFETSGLEITVEPKTNVLRIPVEWAKRKK